MAAKGLNCKMYKTKKTAGGYTVTFPHNGDYFTAGVVQIPKTAIDRSGYQIEALLIDNTTSYYASKIAEAIQRAEGLRA